MNKHNECLIKVHGSVEFDEYCMMDDNTVVDNNIVEGGQINKWTCKHNIT